MPGLALGVKSLPKTQVSLALIGLAHSVLSELSYLTNQKPHSIVLGQLSNTQVKSRPPGQRRQPKTADVQILWLFFKKAKTLVIHDLNWSNLVKSADK